MKTPWKKEQLLLTCNFSFFHSIFYPFWELSATFIILKIVICKLFQFWSKKYVVWERVNPFPYKPWFLRVWSTSLKKTLWEKEKLLSMSFFYPFRDLPAIFSKFKFVVCKLSLFGRVLNMSFGKGVNTSVKSTYLGHPAHSVQANIAHNFSIGKGFQLIKGPVNPLPDDKF